ncbi:MAG: hypothetical protein ACQESR_18185 [Planctomycetota bacterium]
MAEARLLVAVPLWIRGTLRATTPLPRGVRDYTSGLRRTKSSATGISESRDRFRGLSFVCPFLAGC